MQIVHLQNVYDVSVRVVLALVWFGIYVNMLVWLFTYSFRYQVGDKNE